MLHVTLPNLYPWSGMSLPGPDVVHPQVRNVGEQNPINPGPFNHLQQHIHSHQPHSQGQTPGGHNQNQPSSHAYIENMCQQQNVPTNSIHNFHAYNNYSSNINNQQHQQQHSVMRTVGRVSQEGSIRHPSGSSHTSSHRGTPPSPDDNRGRSSAGGASQAVASDQNHLLDRDTRTSFDQCNNPRSDSQGNLGPANPIYTGSSPRRGGSASSPASNLPQKTAFDLTSPVNIIHRNTSLYKVQPNTEHQSSLPVSVLMPPSSSFQVTKVKQEPGSPAQYTTLNPFNKGVKQEATTHPHSPSSINATPPLPSNNNPRTAYTQMERKVIALNTNRPSFSYPSPQSSNPISPASIGEAPRSESTFRYQSSNPVQNPSPGESSTCNSAISSREGTPGPRLWAPEEMSGPAPNVDISRVMVKEEVRTPVSYDANDYTRRPSVNLSYPATPNRPSPTENFNYSQSAYHSPLPQPLSMPPRTQATSTVVPDRGYRPSVGRPPLSVPGNSEGGVPHSNVKIGRRPAHLPKVLKFEDHTLPHGWQRKLKQRKHGKQAGRWDVYIYSPCGVKFASRKKLKHFFEKNNLQYDAEQFDFTPYGKHIENNAASQRHLSSASSEGHRHSGSPGSVHSPTGSGTYPGCHSVPAEFSSLPPNAHNTYMPPTPLSTYEFNPMMESPPNANAAEMPHNQILNLSQTSVAGGGQTSLGSSSSSRRIVDTLSRSINTTTVAGTTVSTCPSNFPTEIDDILNENSDAHFRSRLREYNHDLSSRSVGRVGGDEDVVASGSTSMEEDPRREESERGFMATSINILSDPNSMEINNYMYSNLYNAP